MRVSVFIRCKLKSKKEKKDSESYVICANFVQIYAACVCGGMSGGLLLVGLHTPKKLREIVLEGLQSGADGRRSETVCDCTEMR